MQSSFAESAVLMQVRKVAVIGAGGSGLTAAKCARDDGLEPVIFEQNDISQLGGMWAYDNLPFSEAETKVEKKNVHSSCYETLTTNSSIDMMTFSDFPKLEGMSKWPSHSDITRYLRAYCEHFKLLPLIKFRTRVISVTRSKEQEDKWQVTYKEGDNSPVTESFDAVFVCTGMFWNPKTPILKGQEAFKGHVLHSHYYRRPSDFEGKKVVLVGIGNSALDISMDMVKVSPHPVYISCRHGTTLFPLSDTGKPMDQKIFTRIQQYHLPHTYRKAILAKAMGPLNKTFHQHGLPLPPKNPIHSHYSIVKYPEGRIVLKPDISELKQHSVVFNDGTEVECDAIIFCTGYHKMSFPFLEKEYTPGVEANRLDLYKMYPTLCFIGCIDSIGSLFPISEMQSRWAAALLSGKVPLPSSAAMQLSVAKRVDRVQQRKPKFPLFVNYLTYMDSLAKDLDCVPRLSSSELNVYTKYRVLINPAFPVQYRLQGHGKWSKAPQVLSKL